MYQIFKIRGNSMVPQFKNGDYTIILKRPFCQKIDIGDTIVFKKDIYGTLIKKVVDVNIDGYYVLGTGKDSEDSRHFGIVKWHEVIGKVFMTEEKMIQIIYLSLLGCILFLVKKMLQLSR